MKKKFLELFKNPFLTGSLVMIIGSNFANAINYVYHILMGRLLGPASYGELSAILSLINLLGIVVASISLVTTKFVSAAKSEAEAIAIIYWIGKRINIFSVTT